MNTTEIAIWSCMLGGLLTLCAIALADVVLSRSPAAVRGLLFVTLTSTCCVVLSGLPEQLFPNVPIPLIRTLQASMGPLSGAVALSYLGMWLGGIAQNPLIYRITVWGAWAQIIAGLALGMLAALTPAEYFGNWLLSAAALNAVAIVLATMVALRAALLGDPLARGMVLASFFLSVTIGGLYSRALHLDGLGLAGWALTAASTVAYMLVITGLAVERNRQNRRVARLAGLKKGADPATGLPVGSVLLSKVDDAFWRSARQRGRCTVMCLHLHNLYDLGEAAGHGVEQQILSTMAARIRRSVGFQCVVGLYHPRCFVVVICSARQPQLLHNSMLRLRYLVSKPLVVTGVNDAYHDFLPRWGVGVVTVSADSADPSTVLDTAERAALSTQGWPSPAETPA